MKTYQFYYTVDGKKVLFNLPENRDWAEADNEPALSVNILDAQEDVIILEGGTEVEIVNILED